MLTWIAFRDPRHEAWNFECTVAPLLLSLTPERKRAFLEALKALTQEHYYCAVLLLPPHEKDQPPRYPCDELSPKGPAMIEDLRAQAEAFLQRSVTNQELRDCLEREDTARKRLGEAERELLEALSRKEVTARAQEGDGEGLASRPNLLPQDVPSSLAEIPGVRITRWGRIWCTFTLASATPVYHNLSFDGGKSGGDGHRHRPLRPRLSGCGAG